MEELIIALNNPQNHNAQLVRSTSQAITVGRGYNNDVVLSDPFIAEQQIQFILEEQQWYVDIIQHINPVLLNSQQITTKTAINAGDKLTIGNSLLSVLSKSSPIEKTRKFLLSSWMLHGNRKKTVPKVALLLLGSIFVLYEYFFNSVDLTWTVPIQVAVGQITFVFIWALFWSSIARRFTHHHHFETQIVITSIITLGALLIMPLVGLIEYNSSNILLNQFFEYFISFIQVFLLIKFSMFFWPNIKTTYSMAFIVSLSIHVSSFYIIEYSEETLNLSFPVSSVMLPPFTKMAKSQTIDEFISSNEHVFTQLNETRKDNL